MGGRIACWLSCKSKKAFALSCLIEQFVHANNMGEVLYIGNVYVLNMKDWKQSEQSSERLSLSQRPPQSTDTTLRSVWHTTENIQITGLTFWSPGENVFTNSGNRFSNTAVLTYKE